MNLLSWIKKIAKEYIKLDLITSTDNIEDVMSKVWNPQAPEK